MQINEEEKNMAYILTNISNLEAEMEQAYNKLISYLKTATGERKAFSTSTSNFTISEKYGKIDFFEITYPDGSVGTYSPDKTTFRDGEYLFIHKGNGKFQMDINTTRMLMKDGFLRRKLINKAESLYLFQKECLEGFEEGIAEVLAS